MAEFFNATDLIPRANDSTDTPVSVEPFGLGLEGDFIGFTFNGEHSSHMGITRVSNGNRFNETLLPNFQDKTGSVAGRDGMYYFGSQYGQKPIQIQIAYDCLMEAGVRHLRRVFGDKKPHWLIFDEAPYKKYLVKISQPIQLTYICFMEDNKRIYKGEGQIQFVCYSPFARSVGKTQEDIAEYFGLEDELLPNNDEWATASGIASRTALSNFDTWLSSESPPHFNVYNPGDFPANFKLYLPFNGSTIAAGKVYYQHGNSTDIPQLEYNQITKNEADTNATHICINTALEVIEGAYDKNAGSENTEPEWISTGIVYNKFIKDGNFFNIPITDTLSTADCIYVTNISGTPVLVYDYLYY